MTESRPPSASRTRFWRRFDRWALLVVVVLQAAMLVSHGLRGRRTADAAADTAAVLASSPTEARPTVTRDPAAGRRRTSAVATSPVCFGGTQRAPLSVDSACSMAAWEVLRRSPALDVCEHKDAYEVRLSVPGCVGADARAWVNGRQVEIEVPFADEEGRTTGRVLRRVLLPTPPATDLQPRIEQTNGILRIFFAKPGT